MSGAHQEGVEGGRGSRSQLPLMSVDQQHLTNHSKQAVTSAAQISGCWALVPDTLWDSTVESTSLQFKPAKTAGLTIPIQTSFQCSRCSRPRINRFKGKCPSCNQKAPTATASEHTKSLWGLFHSSSSQISSFCWNFSRNAVELELSSAEAASASSFAAAAVSDRPAAHVPTAGNHGHNS